MIEHGGDRAGAARLAGCAADELTDFSVNLNPLGPPDGAFECYFRSFDDLNRYPEAFAESLAAELAAFFRRDPAEVLPGNGSNQLITLLPACLGCRRAVVVTPGYLEYARACELAGLETLAFPGGFGLDTEQLEAVLRPGDLVLLGNPGNPTGSLTPRDRLEALIRSRPEVFFLVDEAFIDFAGESESLAGVQLPNLLVSRSFTKFYAMPGLRMGALLGMSEAIARIRGRLPAWSVSAPAAAMMRFLVSDLGDYRERSLAETGRLRGLMAGRLAKFDFLEQFPSRANYLLLRSSRPELASGLLRRRIMVRDCRNYPGLGPEYCRIAVRPEEEQELLFGALAQWSRRRTVRRPKPTPALMLQGTCSNAGKSVLTAAFCRIMLQDGFRVAPFKAQNMALNSYVTPDGGEIGRAQAVQAEACRLDPDVRMNPILLKPNSDLGSQVIVKGHAIGNFKVREFYALKPELWRTVRECYRSLASDYQVIVLEGAGSPGEVNLKKNDIVNMNMAAFARAGVLLAGDIDRGGVYASFVGTYATLTPAERGLLAGFLVNKFRGDPTLLDDAHAYVERVTGKPVLGVIDWQRDLGLPEEDSVNFSFIRPAPKHGRTLDLALIQLGHIANFTDFVPFELEPDVTVRKVADLDQLGTPDIIVLPGSKSVAADLAMLARRQGMEKIAGCYRNGAWLVGICGGLQLLGREILDPDGVESDSPAVQALGLLDLSTTMLPEKVVRRSRATRVSDGRTLSGYELHHGRSVAADPALTLHLDAEGRPVGFEKERIFTSYLHGVFDDDAFRREWLDTVRRDRGLPPLGGVTARYETENALNALARHLRERVDMAKIYQMIGLT